MSQRVRSRTFLSTVMVCTCMSLLGASGASAAGYPMSVSTASTSNVTCGSGICTPTASGANLNVSDLSSLLSSSNVTVGDGGPITVAAPLAPAGANALTFDGDTNIEAGAGPLGNVTIDGAATLSGTILLSGSLDVTGTANLNGVVTATGTQTYSGAVSLSGDTTVAAATTTFDSTVDSQSSAHALTVTGSAVFTQNVGTLMRLSSLDVTGSGTATLDGNVFTSGDQTYGEPLLLSGSGQSWLMSTSGSVTASGSIDGPQGLSVTASTTATFGGAVGGTTQLTGLSVQAPTIDLGGSVTTTDGQGYQGAVDLTGDVTATSLGTSAVEIEFFGGVDGAHQLTVDTGTGAISRFDGAIGSTTPLAGLTANSLVILGGGVATTGSQQYNQQVGLANTDDGAFADGSGSTVSFGQGVFGDALTMAGPGELDLANAADSFTGPVTIDGGTVAFTSDGLGSPTVVLDGGTLRWATGNTSDISALLDLGTGGGTLDTGGNDVTFANALSGSGELTKAGSGTLTLTGSGSYGTGLVAQGGTVAVSGTTPTPITIDTGGTLTCENGTLNGGVTNSGGTALGAPGAPTGLSATTGYHSASVAFTPGPANCYPVSYSATANPGGLSWGPQSAGPATFTGLTGGQAYTFSVKATNPIGVTSASASAQTLTPARPTVTITAPANGGTYTLGQVLDASYSCQDGAGGTGISACTGPVASGSAINTSTPGQHSFTVTATSADGETTSATVQYTVLKRRAHSRRRPPKKLTMRLVRVSDGTTRTITLRARL